MVFMHKWIWAFWLFHIWSTTRDTFKMRYENKYKLHERCFYCEFYCFFLLKYINQIWYLSARDFLNFISHFLLQTRISSHAIKCSAIFVFVASNCKQIQVIIIGQKLYTKQTWNNTLLKCFKLCANWTPKLKSHLFVWFSIEALVYCQYKSTN